MVFYMSYKELRPHLEHILENSRLMTVLQPILDLLDGRLMGYEALTRGHLTVRCMHRRRCLR